MTTTATVTASIPTRFTQRYNLRHPFTQAGMAFSGWSPQLACAVTRAGGIGAIGAGLLPVEPTHQLGAAISGQAVDPEIAKAGKGDR